MRFVTVWVCVYWLMGFWRVTEAVKFAKSEQLHVSGVSTVLVIYYKPNSKLTKPSCTATILS